MELVQALVLAQLVEVEFFSPFSPQQTSFRESIALASSKSHAVDILQLAKEEKVKTK
jgi:hypothetical protein